MSSSSTVFSSLLSCFYHWESKKPDAPFLRQPFGDRWEVLTYKEAGEQIRSMATHLKSFPKGTHIGIFSKNCRHWIMADLAISMAGHISVPFFPNLTREQLSEVLEKGDVECLFVGKLDEWASRAPGVPDSINIIRFPHYPGNAEVTEGEDWDTIISSNDPFEGNPEPDQDETWTILFTSGTTGSPKGVVHVHAALKHLMENEEENDDTGTSHVKEHRFFSILPLNHIAERIAVEMMCLFRGGSISFAESQDTFVKNIQDTRPSQFFSVPRLWTKFQSGIYEKLPPKRLNLLMKIPIISTLVKNKIRKNLGFDETEAIFSTSAPLPDALKNWYRKLGIQIRDVYGMTETCGPITMIPPNTARDESVGKVMGNADVKIDPESGEVLLYAPWNMKEYYKDPELTAEVLKDGWVHSGDQGEISEDGFVRITGRVKDTFKSAKGKFIVPNPIELLFGENELIEQVCVVGRGLPQPMILCTLSPVGQETQRPMLEQRLSDDLMAINKELHNYQKLKKVVVLKEEWNVDNRILTPTLKVKRKVIEELYAPRYEEWQEEEKTVVWE